MLQGRSHEEQHAIAHWGAVAITAFVVLVWLVDFRAMASDAVQSTKKSATPLTLLGESFTNVQEKLNSYYLSVVSK